MFAFIVKRLRFLARVPGLPQIFDALLLTHSWIFRRPVFRAIAELETEAAAALPIEMRPHRFGGTGFYLDGRELAHVHGNGLFDALLPKAARDHFVQRGIAQTHHVFPNSRWVSFWIR